MKIEDTKEIKPKRTRNLPKVATQSEIEIDARLAQAIRDRAKAMAMVSKLVHWQDRLARLEQEINSLIGFQQRLSGQTPTIPNLQSVLTPAGPVPFGGHLAPIPDGVTSIPTKVANPKPSQGNVAEVVGGEGGFS